MDNYSDNSIEGYSIESSEKNSSDRNGSDRNGSDGNSSDRKGVMPLCEAVRTLEERSLYTNLNNYFKFNCTLEQIQNMKSIIDNNNIISLRLLNWFAMKFSANMEGILCCENKKIKSFNQSNIKCHSYQSITSRIFDIKISYKARLKTHSKKYFDPFRRGNRFIYHYQALDQDIYIETTLCQLNFFRWLLLHNILEYIEDNYEDLKNKMGIYEKNKKNEKQEKNVEKFIPSAIQSAVQSNYFSKEKIVIII